MSDPAGLVAALGYGLAWLLANMLPLAVPLLVALFAAAAAGLFLLRGFLRWCLTG